MQRAVLVNHDGKMLTAAAEGFELLEQTGGLGHKPGRSDERRKLQLVDFAVKGAHSSKYRFGVDNADDVVRLVTPYRQSCVR